MSILTILVAAQTYEFGTGVFRGDRSWGFLGVSPTLTAIVPVLVYYRKHRKTHVL
ncbi:hypothetical protein J0895_06295 [Phormidium pseudopriestleyi FRX01]|uniref:Uncharacterized protein n=1 Tax=Phormidium pseudopriestleyi FRX01 TaxID=1759528 RepID=A0ABS3FQ21_9CYAN|nr:hypothetical protein [Phormidium pseudopriestleyi]MBO0348716.1 hypothetical protein [Phormidium pseudopriestleyi FRX01]